MSFSTSCSPCSCRESTTMRDLVPGCRVRVKRCKDVFVTNVLCPSAKLGIVRVLQVTAVLPGTTFALVVTTPRVSVLEQPLKHTGKLYFQISKPKRERRGPGKRLQPLMTAMQLRTGSRGAFCHRCHVTPTSGLQHSTGSGSALLPYPTHLKGR